MKNYRVQVETYDGCVTVWYEKSKAKSADKLILNRVYNQLCGLNIKEISVTPSVWIMLFQVTTIEFDFTEDNFCDVLENDVYDMGVLLYREYFLQISRQKEKITQLLVRSF